MKTWDDEPEFIRQLEEFEDANRRAEGLVPCAGPYCDEWLPPEMIVTQDASGTAYGPCCAVIGTVVDADLVKAVCQTIFHRGTVLGRRVSVCVLDQVWAVISRAGVVHFIAYDVFEVARRYCLIESGQADYFDLSAPTEFQPTDAQIAEMDFEDRANDITRRY